MIQNLYILRDTKIKKLKIQKKNMNNFTLFQISNIIFKNIKKEFYYFTLFH